MVQWWDAVQLARDACRLFLSKSVVSRALLHDDGGTELLHGGNHLLGVLLGHVLLHRLGGRLDKLLAVDQAEAQQTLDLLDDLGLAGRVKGLQLQGEEVLLGGGGGSLLGLLDGSGSGGGSSEAANGQVGDVELAL